jgi:hypothetical protein
MSTISSHVVEVRVIARKAAAEEARMIAANASECQRW